MEITTFPEGVPNDEALGVLIDGTMIPAWNVQVLGMPGPYTHEEIVTANGETLPAITHNYPIYFEVRLETNEHLTVEYWGEEEMEPCCKWCKTTEEAVYNVVMVTRYHDVEEHGFDRWYKIPFENWEEFIEWYRAQIAPFPRYSEDGNDFAEFWENEWKTQAGLV